MEAKFSVLTDIVAHKRLLFHNVAYTKLDVPVSVERTDIKESRRRVWSRNELSHIQKPRDFSPSATREHGGTDAYAAGGGADVGASRQDR
jgi:hypothetical protein